MLIYSAPSGVFIVAYAFSLVPLLSGSPRSRKAKTHLRSDHMVLSSHQVLWFVQVPCDLGSRLNASTPRGYEPPNPSFGRTWDYQHGRAFHSTMQALQGRSRNWSRAPCAVHCCNAAYSRSRSAQILKLRKHWFGLLLFLLRCTLFLQHWIYRSGLLESTSYSGVMNATAIEAFQPPETQMQNWMRIRTTSSTPYTTIISCCVLFPPYR
jgi:hypothetical protein